MSTKTFPWNGSYQAVFLLFPQRIEDLCRPHCMKYLKPFCIEKTIQLNQMDYENFITDFCVERWFIEQYAHLCYVDEVTGIWHCLLIQQERKKNGILVQSDGCSFPKHAGYFEWKGENDIYCEEVSA